MQSLDLDLSSVKVASVVTCTVEGILEEDDLRALLAPAACSDAQPSALATIDDPTDLARVREKHHSVARLVASGMTQRLVASITGYTESYLSVLLNNPAMEELVEFYRMQAGAQAQVIGEKLRAVGLKALEQIDGKLDREEVKDVHELAAVAKLGLDRSGHGPSSTQHVVSESHIIDHAQIAELNRAAKEGSREYIVPIGEVRKVLEHKPQEACSDADAEGACSGDGE